MKKHDEVCVSDRTLCVLMSWPIAADVRDSDHLFAAVSLFRSAQCSGNRGWDGAVARCFEAS